MVTHYQVYGEPVITRAASITGSLYHVRCACGWRNPEGDGFLDSPLVATNAAYAHEQSAAFDLGELFMIPEAHGEICRELLRLARDERLRDAVIGRLLAEPADERATIAEACERALVAEVWRDPWWLRDELARFVPSQEAASIEHVLGVLVATALDGPR